jgi:multicomponent Na+:H+ antiporter subunit E
LKHYAQLGILLAIAWLLWSFHFTPLLLTLGGLSILLVLWLVGRMRIVDEEASLVDLKNVPSFFYVPWLVLEIIKANLDVARVILTPSLPIRPRMVRVPATQSTALGKVIYANSITLTPGTVTVDVDEEEGTLLVHALTPVAYDGLLSGEMGERVRNLEKGS